MRVRTSILACTLSATAPLLAQTSKTPAHEPLSNESMPAPTVFDVELDDAYPLEGVRQIAGADGVEVIEKGFASPYYLGFAAGKYTPPLDERVDPLLIAQVQSEPLDGRPAPTAFAFVMFSRRITAARTAELEALGCRVLGFHPGACLKVALPPEQIDAVAALPFVRWVGAPRPEQKVHPVLAQRAAQHHAGVALHLIVNVYESDLGADSTREVIATGEQLDPEARVTPSADPRNTAYRWHSNGWQHQALEALGLEVLQYTEKDSVRAFHVRAAGTSAIEALTGLDFVQFVELEPLAQPHHDESMPLVHADSMRTMFTGGTTQTVVAGEVDSGISPGHSDLYWHLNGWGWDFSGSGTGAWYDACGHGTHVAGTITGDGWSDPAHRGVAPGLGWGGTGRFQLAKIFASCSGQLVDLAGVMGVMRSGSWDNGGLYTPRSHVINNSWGSGPGTWYGSEYSCRLIDDEVYWQRQLYVFSAGNDWNVGAISLEAAAKNAFAVGSVLEHNSWGMVPGERSSFSSQGPTGDWRWKPNVCAPGDWIRSLAANTWDQYTNMGGTSMAAPHVTGIAAQLADQYWWMRYEPQRMAATMMATAVTRGSAPITSQYSTGLNQYGAGRVDAFLSGLTSNQASWQNWGFDLGAGQGTWADVYIAPGTTRVVVCMTWHEWAASAGASYAAINDWDLYIDQEPFSAGTNTGEFNAGLSSVDNTEIRYIDNPTPGWYRWKVHPYGASTNGHFSVVVQYVNGPVNPTVDLTLSQSAYYLQPGQPVTVTANVYNPGYLASGAWVQNVINGTQIDAYKFLNDGAFAPMSGNLTGGTVIGLGNILANNSRAASFVLAFNGDGLPTMQFNADHDSGPGDTEYAYFLVDGTPPSAVTQLVSTTHTPGAYECDANVDLTWTPSTDNLSGVAGYSVLYDNAPTSDPDQWIEVLSASWTQNLPDGGPWYIHVRAVDMCQNLGATAHIGPFFINSTPVSTYCVGKLNSQFCLPYVAYSGRPSVAGPDNFHVTAHNVLNNKQGLMFWALTPANVPFQGGTKCVGSPVRRTLTMNSGGTGGGTNCTGSFDYHWTQAYGAANGIAAGTWVYGQFWYRDPMDSFTTGLTDAVQFVTCQN